MLKLLNEIKEIKKNIKNTPLEETMKTLHRWSLLLTFIKYFSYKA